MAFRTGGDCPKIWLIVGWRERPIAILRERIQVNKKTNSRPMPTPKQWVFIGIGAVAGAVLGFGLLGGGALGGGIFGVCVFLGAIPYKKAVDATK